MVDYILYFYLMSDKVEITDQSIFSDVSNTIKNALKKTFEVNPGKTKLSQDFLINRIIKDFGKIFHKNIIWKIIRITVQASLMSF